MMFGIFGALFSGGGSILARIAGYGLIFLAGTASGAFLMHKIDAGKYEALVAANQRAVTLAVQKAKDIQAQTDKIALDDAVAEAKAQQQIVVQHEWTTTDVPVYVSDTSTCITYGLIRVLDAAILNIDPPSLMLPNGKTNNSCAPIKSTELAHKIINNYIAAIANAEQLNSLESWVMETVNATR